MSAQWPPEHMAPITARLGEWDAWYRGDTELLTTLYGQAPYHRSRPGVVGRVRRWFWGEAPNSSWSPQAKVHVPLAADICQASSDLLFGDPPAVTVEDERTQDRLDMIFNTGAHQVLAGAAETAAALGGVFLRVAWDRGIAPHPFITRVDADRAVPEFRWGRLHRVRFWTVVRETSSAVWRHVETHETDPQGIGIVRHELYEGDSFRLGSPVPLTEAEETAGFATVVDADAAVSTLTPGLAVLYVPNQVPNRAWRHHSVGAHLGRSDLDGVESLLDRLDEAWSSWMREIRVGKARIVASRSALDDNGPGRGASLDLDREVYEAVNTPPGAGDSDLPLKAIQFEIRVQEHRETCQALLEQIIRSAGYSPQTFGAGDDGAAMTATEVQAREASSFKTRKRKLRAWAPALEEIAGKALAIDHAVFGAPVTGEPVSVRFSQAVQESPEALARTVQTLRAAEAVSVETAVRMAHPDWADSDVMGEVDRIRAEQGTPAPDPAVVGVGGFGLEG